MHFLYVFILQFLYKSTCFKWPFRSSSGFHGLTVGTSSNRMTEQLDMFAWFVQSCRYSKSWTPDDERNSHLKHVDLYKNCRINTYRKCLLMVCSYNWLRCTFRTMSKLTVLIISYEHHYTIPSNFQHINIHTETNGSSGKSEQCLRPIKK